MHNRVGSACCFQSKNHKCVQGYPSLVWNVYWVNWVVYKPTAGLSTTCSKRKKTPTLEEAPRKMGHFFFLEEIDIYSFKAKLLKTVSEKLHTCVWHAQRSDKGWSGRGMYHSSHLHLFPKTHTLVWGILNKQTKNRPFVAVGSFMSFLLTCLLQRKWPWWLQ